MKIRIDVNMTPQELRTFLGLPDVEPLQREMMEKIRERMQAGAEDFDPLTLMKPFLPPNLQSMEEMQRTFWQAFSGGSGGEQRETPPADAGKGGRRSRE